MKRFLWSLTGVAALAMMIGLFANTPTVEAAATPGKPAPAFTLTDIHGKEHSLASFKGKHVVLEWVNHGCPFVVKFYKPGKMQELQKKYTDKGVIWLTICSSAAGKQGYYTAEQWREEAKKHKYNATGILLDADGKVGKAYGAKTTPHMFIINPEGTLIYNGAIDSIRSANPADIEKADNYVVQVLDAVLAGKEAPISTTQPYGCSVKY